MIALTSALAVIAAILVATVFVRRRIVVVTVSGTSMTPTLQPGEKLLVRRCGITALKVGDIVVLEPPRVPVSHEVTILSRLPTRTQWQVKRVAALPGDPIPPPAQEAAGTLRTVPGGTLIVLGDNNASNDSRLNGPYPADRILGIALRKLESRSCSGQDARW
ncbi:S26 family signal peptidase [Nonomuraea angiospora]|uniref:S26 family signal peptidase n=1 Tax=Nonomuraea angiospora TaxID=46172 RepID=UPI0029A1E517|nr:S26 family signal peptidase [Nonomuraea angiospora]MDX3104514.1 S26 family signal peptidase [Nonomuraea angiospora]